MFGPDIDHDPSLPSDAALVGWQDPVNPHPSLVITHVGPNVTLAWPALASGFNLQSSTNTAASGGWGDLPNVPQPVGNTLTVSLPLTDQTTYFRLRHP